MNRLQMKRPKIAIVLLTVLALSGCAEPPSLSDQSATKTPSQTSMPLQTAIPSPSQTVTSATTDDTPEEDFSATREADIAEVKSIDAYCKTVDSRKNPDMIFADLSGDVGENKEKWRRFASEKDLENARERSNEKTGGRYKIAYILKKGDRIVGANVMFSSSSGDWVKDVYHYFREDGSLAFVMSHFGTFIGEYKFTQLKYFDRNGRLISKSEEYRDMTDEPMKIKPEDYETADLRDKIDYYMTVSKLPFAYLLPPKAK